MIILQGGLVDGIYSSHRQVQAAVIDWVVFDSHEEDPRITRTSHQGSRIQAHVGMHKVQSIVRLQRSDAEAILLASGEDG